MLVGRNTITSKVSDSFGIADTLQVPVGFHLAPPQSMNGAGVGVWYPGGGGLLPLHNLPGMETAGQVGLPEVQMSDDLEGLNENKISSGGSTYPLAESCSMYTTMQWHSCCMESR